MNSSHRSPAQEYRYLRDYEKASANAHDTFAGLSLSGPVSLESIQSHLESLRGRRIIVQEMAALDNSSICGLWFGLDDVDLIFHAATTGEMHRQQIVLHEFSHILLNHEHEEFRADAFAGLFPDLEPDTVVRALHRGKHGNATEMAAEVLADLLAEQIRTSGAHVRRQPHRFTEVFG
jgi:hypothetical protein